MAQVTVELRNLLKTNFTLFDFEYTFNDPEFKKKLEQAVTDFFYDYEIGHETPEMFKRKFKTRWLRIIDYYNELYNTTLLSYNPLMNYSMSEAMEQLSESSNTQDSINDTTADSTVNVTGNSHSFTDSNTKTSDYPQQAISGGDYLDGESNTITDTTADDTSKTTDKTTTGQTGKVTGSGQTNLNYSKTIEGITGMTYQDLIMKQRDTLLRIPNMVIEEMKPCFILVY